MGGAKFLKGGDIPRRFAPLGGDIPRRFAPGGGEYPRNIAPLFRGGGAISWGGESPVTPARTVKNRILNYTNFSAAII